MNGLRVYINGVGAETRGGCPVFYSRREDGPYYRWSFDDRGSTWQVGRVLRSGVSSKMACARDVEDYSRRLAAQHRRTLRRLIEDGLIPAEKPQ